MEPLHLLFLASLSLSLSPFWRRKKKKEKFEFCVCVCVCVVKEREREDVCAALLRPKKEEEEEERAPIHVYEGKTPLPKKSSEKKGAFSWLHLHHKPLFLLHNLKRKEKKRKWWKPGKWELFFWFFSLSNRAVGKHWHFQMRFFFFLVQFVSAAPVDDLFCVCVCVCVCRGEGGRSGGGAQKGTHVSLLCRCCAALSFSPLAFPYIYMVGEVWLSNLCRALYIYASAPSWWGQFAACLHHHRLYIMKRETKRDTMRDLTHPERVRVSEWVREEGKKKSRQITEKKTYSLIDLESPSATLAPPCSLWRDFEGVKHCERVTHRSCSSHMSSFSSTHSKSFSVEPFLPPSRGGGAPWPSCFLSLCFYLHPFCLPIVLQPLLAVSRCHGDLFFEGKKKKKIRILEKKERNRKCSAAGR